MAGGGANCTRAALARPPERSSGLACPRSPGNGPDLAGSATSSVLRAKSKSRYESHPPHPSPGNRQEDGSLPLPGSPPVFLRRHFSVPENTGARLMSATTTTHGQFRSDPGHVTPGWLKLLIRNRKRKRAARGLSWRGEGTLCFTHGRQVQVGPGQGPRDPPLKGGGERGVLSPASG